MKYHWEKNHKANRNHYICEIIDTLNDHPNPIYSRYFDGTQAKALEFFLKDRKIQEYMGKDSERYKVTMRANSIVLNWLID